MTNNLATALIAAKLKFKPIAKTKTNPHYKSKYACLDSILDAISDALAASGLLLIQPTETLEWYPRPENNFNPCSDWRSI